MTAPGSDKWISLKITSRPEFVDPINNFCIDQGSGGVVIDDSNDRCVNITAYFSTHRWASVRSLLRRFVADLEEIFPNVPGPEITVSSLAREDWATAWQSRFKPMAIGRNLTVTPPWIKHTDANRIPIIIEPAEAFGTGSHETTQGCLELLEDAVEELARTDVPFSLLDLGCGSGILSIAGKKLGAFLVTGVDNDPTAIRSARRNAVLNNLEDNLDLRIQPLRECSEAADIVVANLDPLTLLANSKLIVTLFKCFLILSGVPLDQWAQVKEMFQSNKSQLVKEITRLEWGCGLFRKTL